jgi:hypothetical protein
MEHGNLLGALLANYIYIHIHAFLTCLGGSHCFFSRIPSNSVESPLTRLCNWVIQQILVIGRYVPFPERAVTGLCNIAQSCSGSIPSLSTNKV